MILLKTHMHIKIQGKSRFAYAKRLNKSEAITINIITCRNNNKKNWNIVLLYNIITYTMNFFSMEIN